MPLIRDIHQRFWRLPQLPWLELRTTSESRQAYKRHSHPNCRWAQSSPEKPAASVTGKSICYAPAS